MKKKISILLFWDIFIYIILFFYSIIADNLKSLAAKEFNNSYNFSLLLLNTVIFIIIGLTYNAVINQKNTELMTDKYYIYEFLIIGINSLFVSTLFVWTWLNINILPNWLVSNLVVTCNLGGIIFGLELYRLIKHYFKKLT